MTKSGNFGDKCSLQKGAGSDFDENLSLRWLSGKKLSLGSHDVNKDVLSD